MQCQGNCCILACVFVSLHAFLYAIWNGTFLNLQFQQFPGVCHGLNDLRGRFCTNLWCLQLRWWFPSHLSLLMPWAPVMVSVPLVSSDALTSSDGFPPTCLFCGQAAVQRGVCRCAACGSVISWSGTTGASCVSVADRHHTNSSLSTKQERSKRNTPKAPKQGFFTHTKKKKKRRKKEEV